MGIEETCIKQTIREIRPQNERYFVDGREVYVYFPFGQPSVVLDGKRDSDDYEDPSEKEVVRRKLPDEMRKLRQNYPDLARKINGYLIMGEVGLKSIEQVNNNETVQQTEVRKILASVCIYVEANDTNKRRIEELFGFS